ncbi:TetR/AcrR family transcriptional regulator [Williamsia maris]|uniref:Transcriptional regulator, TetR family n=1 Tax=Williamsia maris TaxID=72806 RepID=A0ABT1HGU3_9NOCA|nr:TetR/AcrR family transcriptional regulator [Williamsia maris]MCP2177456.1 transcriptional regulator, TetR family [Williamsia maris]
MVDHPTRAALVRAGVELLEETGSAEVGLREIARRAGVSHGAPRRWFPTHRALLSAVAAVGLDDLARVVTSSTDGSRHPVRAAALAYIRFAVDRPAMFTLVFRHDLLDGGGSDLRATSRPLMEWFRDLVDDPDRDEREIRAASLWTSVHGIAVLAGTGALALVSPTTSPADLVDAAIAASRTGTRRSDQAGPLRT